MSNPSAPQKTPQPRRPFAAEYANPGWGVALTGFGVVGLLFWVISLDSDAEFSLLAIILYPGLIAWGIYFLRGRGTHPKVAQRQKANPVADIPEAMAVLTAVGRGGATVVAYRNLEATARKLHPNEWQAKVDEALAQASFDPSIIKSPRWGSVPARHRGEVEVFRDWVIYGQEAHDVDATTRARVYVDGDVQVTSAVVPVGKKGKTRVVNTTHDTRTAQLQISSTNWSMGVNIKPDCANEARRLADRLSDYAKSLRPTAATASEIKDIVEKILRNVSQPPAEKLKALSNLRYDRLLSDEEFTQAKQRILGLT